MAPLGLYTPQYAQYICILGAQAIIQLKGFNLAHFSEKALTC